MMGIGTGTSMACAFANGWLILKRLFGRSVTAWLWGNASSAEDFMLVPEIIKLYQEWTNANGDGLSRYFFLRKNLPLATQRPPIANRTVEPLSGTAVAAENENCEEAEGS
jgi:hypothetical protein